MTARPLLLAAAGLARFRAVAPAPAVRAAAGTEPVLSVSEVSHRFGARAALTDVSITVRPGRFVALLGPNGAGKTTLFGLLAGLLGPQSGRLAICGRDLRFAGAGALVPLGLVFQQPTLDLDLTVRQNLRYFAGLRGLASDEARRRIDAELARLGMADRARERVRHLNGGHRRRVEIARALLHGPSVLLLDEPTVGLDIATRRQIVGHVHTLASEQGLGVLWATHLIDEIAADDDLVVLHQGRVVAAGVAREVVSRTGAPDLGAAFDRLTGTPARAQDETPAWDG